jgi:hypothetical protein
MVKQAASLLRAAFSSRNEIGRQKQSDPAGGHPGRVVGGNLGGQKVFRAETGSAEVGVALLVMGIGAEFFRVMSPIVSFVSSAVRFCPSKPTRFTLVTPL